MQEEKAEEGASRGGESEREEGRTEGGRNGRREGGRNGEKGRGSDGGEGGRPDSGPGPAYRRTRRAKPEVLRLARCQWGRGLRGTGGVGRHGPAVPGAAITIPKAVELLTEPT